MPAFVRGACSKAVALGFKGAAPSPLQQAGSRFGRLQGDEQAAPGVENKISVFPDQEKEHSIGNPC